MTASVAEEERVLPAIFEHCKNVYKAMESEAKLVTDEVLEEGHSVRLVWEGHLTKLITGPPLLLSVPYYTSVTRELKRMGCVSQLRRGGGNSSSLWQLHTEPTPELFWSDQNRTNNILGKRHDRIAALEQRVNDLNRLVVKVNTDNEAILDILMERESDA